MANNSEEGRGSQRAVVPVMMVLMMMMMMTEIYYVLHSQHLIFPLLLGRAMATRNQINLFLSKFTTRSISQPSSVSPR
jgi:hypothetical protein